MTNINVLCIITVVFFSCARDHAKLESITTCAFWVFLVERATSRQYNHFVLFCAHGRAKT